MNTQTLNTIDTYIVPMAVTTIQISKDLLEELKKRKLYDKESYEDVIWDLIEDSMELSKETLADIKISQEQFARGEYVTLEEVEARLKKK